MDFNRKYKGSSSFLTAGSATSIVSPQAELPSGEPEYGISELDVLGTIDKLGTPSVDAVEDMLTTPDIAGMIHTLQDEGYIVNADSGLALTPQGELALKYSRIAKA